MVAVVCLFSACQSWRVASGPSPSRDVVARHANGQTLRVLLADGRLFVLELSRVEGDSLFGNLPAVEVQGRPDAPRVTRPKFSPGPVAIALADVQRLDVRRFDAGRAIATGLLVALAGGLGFLLLWLTAEDKTRAL